MSAIRRGVLMLKNVLFLLLAAMGLASALSYARGGSSAMADTAMDCSAIPKPGAEPATGLLPRPRREAAAPPPITAQAAVVVDAESGEVLWGLNEHERRAPASTTKIMTGILAIEAGDLDRVVTAEVDASQMVGSSVMGLRPGVQITVRDLLYGLMLPSGNDAAVELARAVDGDIGRFVDRMNRKAAELGLRDTHFMNPHGLDKRDHFSSAHDLAMLGRYAMGNEMFRQVAGAQYWQLSPPSDYGLANGNTLLNPATGVDGVKIGWTGRAGWTFVASAVRDGRRLIVTVLNSQDRNADAGALLDWAYASHDWIGVTPKMTMTLELARRMGVRDELMSSLSACSA